MRWQQLGAFTAGVLLVLTSSCTADGASGPVPNMGTTDQSAAPSTSGDQVAEQRLLSSDPATFPLLPTALPRHVPPRPQALPSVLEDPPSRVLMTYHPPESFQEDAEGWASEQVLFYGADGRWRRLGMEDLRLPEAAWPGPDTYGAGELSPDGHWWAANSLAGVVLLNLRTGDSRLVRLPLPRVAQLTWLPDSSSFVAFYGDGPATRTIKVSVPHARFTPVPYQQYRVGFEEDGTPVALERLPDGQARMVAWQGRRKVGRGRVPAWLVQNMSPMPVLSAPDWFALVASPPNRFRKVRVAVVDSATREVQAVLRVRPDDHHVHGLVGWLDAETLLLQTAHHIVAWRPNERRIYRVTEAPPSKPATWWTVNVATDAA